MSTLREYITPETIAQTVRMCRVAQPKNLPIVLVEGDTDVRVYRWSLKDCVEIAPGDGKQKNLDALALLCEHDQYATEWLILIIDADFDHILGESYQPPVFVTDLHDIECEYLRSFALEKVLEEIGSRSRCLREFGSDVTDDPATLANAVRNAVLEAGKFFGAIRLFSMQERRDLCFKYLNHSKAFVPDSLTVSLEDLARVVAAANSDKGIDQTELLAVLSRIDNYDLWQLCQGHDLMAIFALGMRRCWGDRNVGEGDVRRSLRLSFEAVFFWQTQCGKQLQSHLTSLGVTIPQI
jgi:hypothetical protein